MQCFFTCFSCSYLSANKYDEANSLLFSTASKLLSDGQFESGCDLAVLLTTVLKKQSTVFEDQRATEACERFATLFSLMESSKQTNALRLRFKRAAIEYLDTLTVTNDTERARRQALVSKLHHRIALTCWKQCSYAESRSHFERTSDGESLGQMLVQYQLARGYESEAERFGAQTVLGQLVLRKPVTAARCLLAYCASHPQFGCAPPLSNAPLLNFCYLLLLAVARACDPASQQDDHKRSQSLLSILVKHYEKVLVDADFREKLDSVGQSYFGLPSPSRPRNDANFGSLLSNVFQMFGGPTASQSSSAAVPSRAADGGLNFGSMLREMMVDMVGEENMSDDEMDSLLD